MGALYKPQKENGRPKDNNLRKTIENVGKTTLTACTSQEIELNRKTKLLGFDFGDYKV